MRIALVIGNYDALGGGAERWTDVHARLLIERGHDVHLVARRFRGAPEEAICHTVDASKTGHRRRLRFGGLAERILTTLDADVVHDMGDGWYADLFMPHHGTRRGTLKYNERTLSPLEQRVRRFANKWVPRYREFRALERRQYEFSTGKLFLAVSRMIRDHMIRYCHVPPDRIRLVYNAVDTERFRPAGDAADRAAMREKLGVRDEALFLMVAHNFRLKGLDTVLRALARFDPGARGIKLVVVGAGPIGPYQSMARTLGCHDAVRFVGDQPDTRPYYRAADVFVLPTYYDPCSLVVLEAMASGLPIITTTRNGVHELMEPGREALILDDPADVAALVDAMRAYLDPDLRAGAGAAARALAEKHSLERTLERYMAIYGEIGARARAGARRLRDGPTTDLPAGARTGRPARALRGAH